MTEPGAIDVYVRRLEAALAPLSAEDRVDVVAEVRAHLEDAGRDAADPESAVLDAMAALGTPEAFAAKLRARGEEPDTAADRGEVKRFLGMPYNFAPMSAERVASRIWNPADPRVFMPRIFGIGWSINFGAIAVRLGLMRADDEEPLPFTRVPGPALDAGLAGIAPLDVVWAVVAFAYRGLERLPVHWGLTGPDGFASATAAAAYFLAPALVLFALALFRRFAGRAGRTERTLTVCGLASFSAMLAGFHVTALAFALTGRELYPAWAPVLGGLAILFGSLVGYSRLGLRAEWRDARVG